MEQRLNTNVVFVNCSPTLTNHDITHIVLLLIPEYSTHLYNQAFIQNSYNFTSKWEDTLLSIIISDHVKSNT